MKAPIRLACCLICIWLGDGLLSSVLQEGKHVPAGKKPYVAIWELHCKQSTFLMKFFNC